MNIDTSKLPMTVETVRQEVIKNEGDKIVARKLNKVFIISMSLIIVGVVLISIRSNLIITIFTEVTGLAILILAFSGKIEHYYHKKFAHGNYGLSEDDISNRMIAYMENMLDKMNDELEVLDKKKTQIIKDDKDSSKAYYEIYVAYTKLIIQVNPQYYSSMEGGDRY